MRRNGYIWRGVRGVRFSPLAHAPPYLCYSIHKSQGSKPILISQQRLESLLRCNEWFAHRILYTEGWSPQIYKTEQFQKLPWLQGCNGWGYLPSNIKHTLTMNSSWRISGVLPCLSNTQGIGNPPWIATDRSQTIHLSSLSRKRNS